MDNKKTLNERLEYIANEFGDGYEGALFQEVQELIDDIANGRVKDVASHVRVNTLVSVSRKVAVIDGKGNDATVGLYLEDTNGEIVAELPWPDDWDEYIYRDKLREHGYKIITA